MNRRSFTIFNFSFLDWMVGFLGCVIIQLLLAQKSVEQRPALNLRKVVYAYIDTVKGITWGYSPEDLYHPIQSGDSLLAVTLEYKSLPVDTIGQSIAIQTPVGPPSKQDTSVKPPPTPEDTARPEPCPNCPSYPGLVNIAVEYDNPDDRFYLYAKAKNGRHYIGFDVKRYDSDYGLSWVPILSSRNGRRINIGERIVQQEKIIPGEFEIYIQYWGNRTNRQNKQSQAIIRFTSKLQPGSNTFFKLDLSKAKGATDRTLVARVRVNSDGTLQIFKILKPATS